MADQHQKQIDELLERYLSLLDTYSSLRQELSKLQSGVYQGIARANFAGERGMRYGRDHYDGRMRAQRVLDVEMGEEGVPIYRIREAGGQDNDENHDGDDGDDDGGVNDQKEESNFSADSNDDDAAEIPATETPKKKTTKKTSNPLHWFGLFAPPALRTAQSHSIRAVEDIIPRLLSVNAEMASVEIQVRRARKRRAKVALAAEKEALAV